MLTCFLIWSFRSDGQQNDRLKFTFKNISTATGLAGNQINSVVQDSAGFVWIGGTDGLQRYDGIRFKTFRHRENDSTSLPVNQVLQLLVDKKQRLWVLLGDGKIGIFNTKTFIFRLVETRPKNKLLLPYSLKKITSDEFGNIFYLLRPTEILVWSEEENAFTGSSGFFPHWEDWDCEDLVQQPGTENYWMGLFSGGFLVFNKKTGAFSYAGHNTDQFKIIDRYKNNVKPYNLFFDSKGRLWFQFWESYVPLIYCYDVAHGKPFLEKAELHSQLGIYHETSSFFEQSTGDIWITGNKVFGRFNEKQRRFELVQNAFTSIRSIEYESVTSLSQDKENNIWVSTSNNGLYVFNPQAEYFKNVPHYIRLTGGRKGAGSVYSFFPDKDGTVLAGTWGDGLYRYDSNWNVIPLGIKGIPDNNGLSVWCMAASGDKRTVWLSSQPGIWQYDMVTRKAVYHNPPALENRTIRQVAEDRFGNLWLGMQHIGLRKWSPIKGARNFNDGISTFSGISRGQHINKIYIDSKGYVWVTCTNGGVYMIDPATDKIELHFSDKGQGVYNLGDQGGSTVLEYNDSLMIIASPVQLYGYNRIRKTQFKIGSSGIISGYITALEKDENGYVWLTTSGGLYRITLHSGVFVLFDRRDGIANERFEIVSSRKLPDGRMMFGSTDQFIVFRPQSIQISESKIPPVYITDFRVNNKSLLVDSLLRMDKIVLGPNQNSVVIDVSTLQLASPFLIRYRMDNLDKEWHITDQTSSAIYSYIPAGHYTLLLKAEDAEGKDGPVTSVQIRVEPAFWETWWFFSLLILLAALLLFWFDRERIRRKEDLYKMRTDIAGELHQEVNLALNNINILSEMARLKAEKDTAKAIEYIEQINVKSQSMIAAMDDMLWIISPENDSMIKNIDHLKQYIGSLSSRFNTPVDLLVDKKVYELNLDMKLRQHILRMFKSGITNFLRTGGSNCKIYIGLEKNWLTYTVEFDNSHTDFQQLNNLLKRQELENWLHAIHATLDVETLSTNTVVMLKIPVK